MKYVELLISLFFFIFMAYCSIQDWVLGVLVCAIPAVVFANLASSTYMRELEAKSLAQLNNVVQLRRKNDN